MIRGGLFLKQILTCIILIYPDITVNKSESGLNKKENEII